MVKMFVTGSHKNRSDSTDLQDLVTRVLTKARKQADQLVVITY